MAHPVDFYFDFSSPFGYMASTRVDELAAKYEREVVWRPILLGAVYKVNGVQPTPNVPLKGDYARRDILRTAKYHNIDCKIPSAFPISSVPAARAFYWLDRRNPEQAIALAKALFHAYFVEDRNISNPDEALAVCKTLGLDTNEAQAGINDQSTKDLLKTEVENAIARGVFGSPYLIIDGEPFWGMDRLDQAEKWLRSGGW